MVSELRPRGIGEILDSAVALYRARFTKLIIVAATVVVPVQILTAIVLLSAQPDHYRLSATGTVSPQYDSNPAVQFGAVVTVAIVGVLSSAFVIAVCTRLVATAYIGDTSATRDAVKAVRPRTFAIIGTSLLVLISEGIGLVFCFIGALVSLTVFAVAIPVLILEGIGVSAALGRSVTLTKNHVMHVLGVVLTAQLLRTVLNVALGQAASLVLRSGGGTASIVITQSVASTISAILTTPFVATTVVALYFDLRIRDEAFDIQLLMRRNDARIVV